MTTTAPLAIRPAVADDAERIADLVNRYAARNIMLPRTEASVRATLADWRVAVEEDPAGEQFVGCGSLVLLTESLVEIRSLAIAENQQGKGVGSQLVRALVDLARKREFAQVCALTLSEAFFTRLGFELVDRWSISPKVWQACIYCPKFHHCDEVAVLMNLSPSEQRAQAVQPAAWNGLLKWQAWQPLKLAYQQKPTTTDE